MRYYLDTEFDGHNGPLLSVGLVREDGHSLHVRTKARADDPWVQEHVEPRMDWHMADVDASNVRQNHVGGLLRRFVADDAAPTIIADSVVDIARFCKAISTDDDGNWCSVGGDMMFEVHDVSCYPTDLPGGIQHNAWWDAMALKYKLTNEVAQATHAAQVDDDRSREEL